MFRFQRFFTISSVLCLALLLPGAAGNPWETQKSHDPGHLAVGVRPHADHEFPFSFGPIGLTRLMQQVGLADAQMQQFEQIFQENRNALSDLRVEVEKKERDLQVLLDAPKVDHRQAEPAVDALLEARNRLAKATSMMMVRMRQVVTQEQWRRMQDLQRQSEAESFTFPPTGAKRVRIDSQVQAGKLISKARPEYPRQAKQARIQGAVLLEALIDVNGNVSQLRVVSGPPLLAQAAVDAVRQWRYQPALLNNEPVEVVTTIDVVFTLSQ